jgi:hypothetical protein
MKGKLEFDLTAHEIRHYERWKHINRHFRMDKILQR